MKTVYDWVTVVIFAALVTHFLHQSADRERRQAPLWQYGLAAAGCALANWLGNRGYTLAAIAAILLTVCFIGYVYLYQLGSRDGH